MHDLLKRIFSARVSEVLPQPTPLQPAPRLSTRLGTDVWLKREDLSPVFSFKLRGAYNRIARLDATALGRGVIAASAGNHAQGVAYACQRRGAECWIVMPRTSPSIKVDAVRAYGAHVELAGDSYSDAATRASEVARQRGMTPVHPFDDLDVIAGQGTVGVEVLRQAPVDLSAVLVPIGGGGLASGVGLVLKELKPSVRVIGVQAKGSDAMRQSIQQGRRVSLAQVGIFADGVAVKQVGDHTLELCRRYLDDILLVDEDEICAAIKDGFEETRTLFEPAGALSIAGLKRLAMAGPLQGAHVAIASGANIAMSRFGYVAERAEIGEQREALLCVAIPEQPGSFLGFCRTLGERNLTEFNYRLASRQQAHVFVGVEISHANEAAKLIGDLRASGYATDDLSQDEVVKTHVRYMVGGVATRAQDEVFYTFRFPERPGALLAFLQQLGTRWNISLFHYRNQGAGFGRVLLGLEVPPAERPALDRALSGPGLSLRRVPGGPLDHFLRG